MGDWPLNLRKKIELLAPCGNMASLRAAVFSGADAVYLGGKSFGARALADNFDHDEINEAVTFCHLYGVKVHATVNTMIYEKELDNAFKEMDFLYEIGTDALILSDIGLLTKARSRYPDIEIHVSTQAHIHNVNGAIFMESIGANRVVLDRELPLASIKEITSAIDIETEVFVHGALCISYSGQCLMGSILFSRSGNRGICAQCCRMRYRIFDKDNDKTIKTDGMYLLSPSDLNILEHIPSFIEAGVASIKIEGRMKRAEYVAYVTRLYRMAIDAYYAGQEFKVDKTVLKELKLLFNRDFTSGHIFSDAHIYNPTRPNHIGIKVGEVISNKNGFISIRFSEDIAQGDGLRILVGDKEYGLVTNMMYRDGKLSNHIPKGKVGSFAYENIPIGSKVYKTSDISLTRKIKDLPIYRKVPIRMYYEAKVDKPFYLRVSDDTHTIEVTGDIVQKAKSAPLDKAKIQAQLAKCNDTAYELVEIDGVTEDVFLALSQINAVRRKALQELDAKRTSINKRRILDYNEYKPVSQNMPKYLIEVSTNTQVKSIKEMGIDALLITANKSLVDKDIYYLRPIVNESGVSDDYNLAVAAQFGDLQDAFIAYSSFNIANHLSIDFFLKRGFKAVILSLEISDEDIRDLKEYYLANKDHLPVMYTYIYGKRDLMQLKLSPLVNAKERLDEKHHYALVDDFKRDFEVVKKENSFALLENETHLLKRDYASNYFIRFTDETASKVQSVIRDLSHIYD